MGGDVLRMDHLHIRGGIGYTSNWMKTIGYSLPVHIASAEDLKKRNTSMTCKAAYLPIKLKKRCSSRIIQISSTG
jgi:hypothetical protein